MSSDKAVLLQGDCLEVLKELPSDSLDSLVTDPPAGIAFMGKSWDEDKGGRKEWINWLSSIMSEALRVLKPGAHGLVWAIPRTSHWTATALEDAGFEVRDVVTHLFGSGFPKSHNLEKAGAGPQWQGWGTALKPASEHWILVRKPCSEKTVAANVLKHSTGGINIDASRIGTTENLNGGAYSKTGRAQKLEGDTREGTALSLYEPGKSAGVYSQPQGRFPANLLLSHNHDCTNGIYEGVTCTPGCPISTLDEQSGVLSPGHFPKVGSTGNKIFGKRGSIEHDERHMGSGGASRFFYCAKASKKDKNAGCEGLPKRIASTFDGNVDHEHGNRKIGAHPDRPTEKASNFHPTVKSTSLMSYLITLITPPGGIVLDPFMGSGTTGVSAIKGGFGFLGIEREADYLAISQARIDNAEND